MVNNDNRASGLFYADRRREMTEKIKENVLLLLLDTSKRTRIFFFFFSSSASFVYFELSFILDNSSIFFNNDNTI
jgi:hypothetical protein